MCSNNDSHNDLYVDFYEDLYVDLYFHLCLAYGIQCWLGVTGPLAMSSDEAEERLSSWKAYVTCLTIGASFFCGCFRIPHQVLGTWYLVPAPQEDMSSC